MPFCCKCGTSIKEGGLFCPKCGLKLQVTEEKIKKLEEKTIEPKPKTPEKEVLSKAIEQRPERQVTSTSLSEFGNKKSLTVIGLAILAGIIIVIILVAVREPAYQPSYQSPSYGEPTYGSPTETTGQPSGYNEEEKVKIVCGDNRCDAGETTANCCLDCGCASGYECDPSNNCVISKPEIEYDYSVRGSESATVLYALPEDLINTENPLITVKLNNKGSGKAKNVQLKVKLGEYSDWTTKNIGDMSAGESKEVKVTPRADSKILSLTTDTNVPVQFKLTYEDASNQAYSKEDTKETMIKGRNTFAWSYPELTAAWVTSTDPIVRDFATEATAGLAPAYRDEDIIPAVNRIFDEASAFGVRYASDPSGVWGDYLQFPIETLHRKNGDCDDMAVLFASLLRAVGIKAGVVLIPGHAYTWYEVSGVKYALEGTRAGGTFSTSLLTVSLSGLSEENYDIIDPDEEINKGVKMVNLPNPPSVDVPQITITLDSASEDCGIEWGGDWYYCNIDLKFSNSGGQGHRCVDVYNVIKGSSQTKDVEKICTPVPSGSSTKTVKLDASLTEKYEYKYDIARTTSINKIEECYKDYGLTADTVIFYHRNGCPYCEQMKPIVQSLEGQGYKFHWAEQSDSEAQKVVNDCYKDVLQNAVPEFICAGTYDYSVGARSEENLKKFADTCKA